MAYNMTLVRKIQLTSPSNRHLYTPCIFFHASLSKLFSSYIFFYNLKKQI